MEKKGGAEKEKQSVREKEGGRKRERGRKRGRARGRKKGGSEYRRKILPSRQQFAVSSSESWQFLVWAGLLEQQQQQGLVIAIAEWNAWRRGKEDAAAAAADVPRMRSYSLRPAVCVSTRQS